MHGIVFTYEKRVLCDTFLSIVSDLNAGSWRRRYMTLCRHRFQKYPFSLVYKRHGTFSKRSK